MPTYATEEDREDVEAIVKLKRHAKAGNTEEESDACSAKPYLSKTNIQLSSKILGLAVALEDFSAKGIDVCQEIFIERPPSDYIEPVLISLSQLSGGPLVEAEKILGVCTALNLVVHDVKQECLKRKQSGFSKERLYSILEPHERLLKERLLTIMKDKYFPKRALPVFVYGATFYMLLLQEMALSDPKVALPINSDWVKKLRVIAKMCVKHVLVIFTKLWHARLEGISKLMLSKAIVHSQSTPHVRGKVTVKIPSKQPNVCSQKASLKLCAVWYDRYDSGRQSEYSKELIFSEENLKSLIEEFTAIAYSKRDRYITDMLEEFDGLMNFPLQITAFWLKLIPQPFARSAEDGLVNTFVRRTYTSILSPSQTMSGEFGDLASGVSKLMVGTGIPAENCEDFFEEPSSVHTIETILTFDPPGEESEMYQYIRHLAPETYSYVMCFVAVDGRPEFGMPMFEVACLPRDVAKEINKTGEEHLSISPVKASRTKL